MQMAMAGHDRFVGVLRDEFQTGTGANLLLVGDEDGEEVNVIDVGELGILFKGERSVVFAPWAAVRFMSKPIPKAPSKKGGEDALDGLDGPDRIKQIGFLRRADRTRAVPI